MADEPLKLPFPLNEKYIISEDGRVWGPSRRELSLFEDKDGYLRFNTSDHAQWPVHQAVCYTFNGGRPTRKHHAAHINENKRDNHASNLYWATPAENEADKSNPLQGERHPMVKLKTEDVINIRSAREEGMSLSELSLWYGVTVSTVWKIVHRKTWRHL